MMEKIRIPLPYKIKNLTDCIIPKDSLHHIYDLPKVSSTNSLKDMVRHAISNPIGSNQLSEVVRNKSNIVIIIDDITRPTPTDKILPIVIKEIEEAGHSSNDITILVALGSHRKMETHEIISKVGSNIYNDYRVLQSHFDEPEKLKLIGISEDGVEIYIDEVVASADIKIGIGSIVPHGAVGWSGGGKIIYPGVAGKKTVTQFHFTHGLTQSNFTGHDETIVRDRMEKWVEIVGLDFIINAILTPEAEVYDVVAGHFIRAHREGIKKAHKAYIVPFFEQSDVAIAVSHPHDHDFWQAAKGIYCSQPIVREGGDIILVTPCTEGVGVHKDFPRLMNEKNNAHRIQTMLEGKEPYPKDPLPIAPAAMVEKMRKTLSLHIVSPGIEIPAMHEAGIIVHKTIESAINHILSKNHKAKFSVVRSAEICFRADNQVGKSSELE